MNTTPWLVLGALLAVSGAATGVTFEEDFEAFSPGESPDRDWYDYTEQTSDLGTVTATELVIEGERSMLFDGSTTDEPQNHRATFTLEAPAQLDALELKLRAHNLENRTEGSHQVIKIQSSPPVRTMVEFHVICLDEEEPHGCEFKIRFNQETTTGLTYISPSTNITQTNIRIEPDWRNGEFLFIENGTEVLPFPFWEIPEDIGRIQIQQFRGDIPMHVTLDQIRIEGGEEPAPPEGGDVADGIKQFAQDIRFDTGRSQFILGLTIFLTLLAAVILPMVRLGHDNTIIPATSFFGTLTALWLVLMEFWPEWIGILLIIIAAAAIAMVIRKAALGVQDANSGPSLVLGSMGYFIIASTLLSFSGFATDTVELPTDPTLQVEDDAGEEITETQTFTGAVLECIFTGGVFTYGLIGDCSQNEVTTTWKRITDSAGRIFGWVRASIHFVYQMISFRLPIPALFNIIIIGPPAGALSAYGVEVISGARS